MFDAQSTFFAAIVKVEHDGEKWKDVLPGSVGFDAHLKVDTKGRGYVERVGVWLGDCNGTGCGSNPRILFEVPMQRDYDVNRSLSFPVEQLLEARSGALVLSQADRRWLQRRAGEPTSQLQDDGRRDVFRQYPKGHGRR